MNEHARSQQFASATDHRKTEAYERKGEPGVWATESFGSDGECYLTAFYGPDSEHRAKEYAAFQAGQ